jgi:hypothetical protein
MIIMKKNFIFALTACFGLSALASPETYVIENAHTFPLFH